MNSLAVTLFLNKLLELIFCIHLDGYKYPYVTVIILFNINQLLHTVKWFSNIFV